MRPEVQPFEEWWKDQSHLVSPGERQLAEKLDLANIELVRVPSEGHHLFFPAYQMLSSYFGPRRQLESLEILAERLAVQELSLVRNWRARYELLALVHREKMIGVRDHVLFSGSAAVHAPIYQAHIFVVQEWRRTGLAAWMRALPLISALKWRADNSPESGKLDAVMVAEIERSGTKGDQAERALRSYIRAGYGILPDEFAYQQPEVTSTMTKQSTGACATTRMHLAFRFPDRELDEPRKSSEIAACLEAIYSLHASEFPAQDLRALWEFHQSLLSVQTISLTHKTSQDSAHQV